MPRWLLPGLLIVVVVILAARLLDLVSPRVPEDCEKAANALEAGRYDDAIDDYLRCLETEDLRRELLAQVYYGLGIAYSAKGNHLQAIEDYSETIRLAPEFPWAYNNRCWSYGLMGQGEKALPDCEEALRLSPDQPEILDSRALAHWLLDDKDKARRDLERARQLDPTIPTWEERFREFDRMF